jgi:hypothetical protein
MAQDAKKYGDCGGAKKLFAYFSNPHQDYSHLVKLTGRIIASLC